MVDYEIEMPPLLEEEVKVTPPTSGGPTPPSSSAVAPSLPIGSYDWSGQDTTALADIYNHDRDTLPPIERLDLYCSLCLALSNEWSSREWHQKRRRNATSAPGEFREKYKDFAFSSGTMLARIMQYPDGWPESEKKTLLAFREAMLAKAGAPAGMAQRAWTHYTTTKYLKDLLAPGVSPVTPETDTPATIHSYIATAAAATTATTTV